MSNESCHFQTNFVQVQTPKTKRLSSQQITQSAGGSFKVIASRLLSLLTNFCNFIRMMFYLFAEHELLTNPHTMKLNIYTRTEFTVLLFSIGAAPLSKTIFRFLFSLHRENEAYTYIEYFQGSMTYSILI